MVFFAFPRHPWFSSHHCLAIFTVGTAAALNSFSPLPFFSLLVRLRQHAESFLSPLYFIKPLFFHCAEEGLRILQMMGPFPFAAIPFSPPFYYPP